jgi:hypothetical protein
MVVVDAQASWKETSVAFGLGFPIRYGVDLTYLVPGPSHLLRGTKCRQQASI